MRERSEIISLASRASSRSELNQLTVKELRIAVREAVKDVNVRMKSMESEQSKVALNKLKIAGLEFSDSSISKAEKQMRRAKVSANVNYKSKVELMEQMKALNKFRKMDYESDVAKAEYEAGWQSAYEAFQKSDTGSRYDNISAEEFRDITNKLDTFADVIDKETWKYEIFEAVSTAKAQGQKVDLVSLFRSFENGGTESDIRTAMYDSLGVVRR